MRKVKEDLNRFNLHIGFNYTSLLYTSSSSTANNSVKKNNIRGKIKTFSKNSRKRLLKTVLAVDLNKLKSSEYNLYFVTLTYQSDFFRDVKNMRKVKEDLNRFNLYIRRKFSKIIPFYIWRLEFTKKGVPHFHLLLPSCYDFKTLKRIISKLWVDCITANVDYDANIIKRMYKAATNIKLVKLKDTKKLIVYLNKYMAKIDNTLVNSDFIGRFWGVYNRERYKEFCLNILLSVKRNTFYRIRRILVNLLNSRLRFTNTTFRYKLRYFYSGGITVFYLHYLDFLKIYSLFEK